MVSDALLRLKSELALTLDADNYACGTYVGYGFTLRALNDKNCIIFNSWARKSALTTKTVDDFFKEYMSKPENSFVKAYKAGEPNISAVLFAGNDDAQAVLDIKRFITDMVKYYSANYYSNACANCNSSIGLSFAKASDGNVKQLCKMWDFPRRVFKVWTETQKQPQKKRIWRRVQSLSILSLYRSLCNSLYRNLCNSLL